MTKFIRPAALIAILTFAMSLFAAPATHDLKVELKALNTISGQITYPGPVKFQIKVTNLGPGKVTNLYKMNINKFDHTGQRWLKSVFTRELPLLDAPGGNLTYFTYQVEDTAGDPRTDEGITFIYRASLGPGYYTDPKNANNNSNVGVRFNRRVASNASEPLFEVAVIPAGATIVEAAETEAAR
jgi:hypothetical protein